MQDVDLVAVEAALEEDSLLVVGLQAVLAQQLAINVVVQITLQEIARPKQ